eukprot:4217745-Pleurochrysis_carterae.AAC.1
MEFTSASATSLCTSPQGTNNGHAPKPKLIARAKCANTLLIKGWPETMLPTVSRVCPRAHHSLHPAPPSPDDSKSD